MSLSQGYHNQALGSTLRQRSAASAHALPGGLGGGFLLFLRRGGVEASRRRRLYDFPLNDALWEARECCVKSNLPHSYPTRVPQSSRKIVEASRRLDASTSARRAYA